MIAITERPAQRRACPDVQRASSNGRARPIERRIAHVRFTARDADFRLCCDSIAYDEDAAWNHLLVLSVMGPQTSIKAVAAMLQSDVHCGIKPEGIDDWHDGLSKHPNGYTIHRHRFEHNTWHMLAVARQEGLLLRSSAEALWVELRKPRFTTPVLRGWVPWLMRWLEESGHLRSVRCFGCESALLTAGTPELDEAVTTGLGSGNLEFR